MALLARPRRQGPSPALKLACGIAACIVVGSIVLMGSDIVFTSEEPPTEMELAIMRAAEAAAEAQARALEKDSNPQSTWLARAQQRTPPQKADDDLAENDDWRAMNAERESNAALANPDSVPRQIMVTLVANLDSAAANTISLLFSWTTGPEAKNSYVEWTSSRPMGVPIGRFGFEDTVVVRSLEGAVQFGSSDECMGEVGHRVILRDMPKGRSIRYSVGDASVDVWSPVRTLSAIGSPTKSIVMYGDGDSGPRSEMMMHALSVELRRRPYQMAIHLGDAGYGHLSAPNDLPTQCDLLDRWFSLQEPVLSRMAFMLTPGNHDAPAVNGRSTWAARCANLALERLPMMSHVDEVREPYCPFPTEGPWWYTWRMSYIRFISLSSEHDLSPGSPQHEWLRGVLEIANSGKARDYQPFVFVYMHRPMYCSHTYTDCKASAENLRGWLEELFIEFKVDAVFSGHVHVYERTHPTANGERVAPAEAPVYFNVGTGGAPVRPAGGDFETIRPEWSAARIQGIGMLRIVPESKHVIRFLFYQVDEESGETSTTDSFELEARQTVAKRAELAGAAQNDDRKEPEAPIGQTEQEEELGQQEQELKLKELEQQLHEQQQQLLEKEEQLKLLQQQQTGGGATAGGGAAAPEGVPPAAATPSTPAAAARPAVAATPAAQATPPQYAS